MSKTKEQQSKLYYLWCGMNSRCNYKKNRNYKNYGARGIKVCNEWKDFKKFKEWALNNNYQENVKRGQCTLDRIDNNKNYEPNNCRFITNKQQCNNKRNNIVVKYKNEEHTLKEWCEILKLKYQTILRKYHNNWNVKDMFECPAIIGNNQYKK